MRLLVKFDSHRAREKAFMLVFKDDRKQLCSFHRSVGKGVFEVTPKELEELRRIKGVSGFRDGDDLFTCFGMGGVSDFNPQDFFPDVKPRELSPEEKAESEARTRAWRFLESQQPGQHLKVGRHDFTIWRSRGSEVFMTKGKGRKLYKLETVSFHPVTFEVIEVYGGSGLKIPGKKAIARFQP